jgi:hypothetical protein
MIRRVLAPIALVAALASAADAQTSFVIDFEDLAYGREPGAATEWDGGALLSSYRGFEWTNFRPLDLVNYQFQPAGYPRTRATGDVLGVGFGPVSMIGESPFMLLSGVFGSGWTDPTVFTVNGYLGAELQFTREVRLGTAGPTAIDFGAFLVDQVVFTPDFLPEGYADTFESGRSTAASRTSRSTPTTSPSAAARRSCSPRSHAGAGVDRADGQRPPRPAGVMHGRRRAASRSAAPGPTRPGIPDAMLA